jgi:hypothetical protein
MGPNPRARYAAQKSTRAFAFLGTIVIACTAPGPPSGPQVTTIPYPAQAKQAGGSEQKSSAEAASPPEAPSGPSEEEAD